MEKAKNPRNPFLLFLGLTGFIAITAYVNILSPDTVFTIGGFFVLLMLATELVSLYILQNARLATLLTLGITVYLGLRFLGLRQPMYAILLAASVIALEYLGRDHVK